LANAKNPVAEDVVGLVARQGETEDKMRRMPAFPARADMGQKGEDVGRRELRVHSEVFLLEVSGGAHTVFEQRAVPVQGMAVK